MFYEASEGGAGVLNALVREPETMQRIARRALSIMHYAWEGAGEDASRGSSPKSVDVLQNTEDEKPVNSRCVKGCYRCLLSYFNQPQHNSIDRTDKDALNILVELANATANKVETEAEATVNTDDQAKSLDEIIDAAGCVKPDAYNKDIMNGAYKVLAMWKTYKLVLLDSIPTDELKIYLESRSYSYIVIGGTATEWESAIKMNMSKLPGNEEDL